MVDNATNLQPLTLQRELVFTFDYISPYAWIAWHTVRKLSAEFDVTLRPNPVLFAALLNHHGQKGPAEIPAKRRYTFVDVLRKAQASGVSIDVPHTHPFNPLRALRATVAAAERTRQLRLVQQLFEAVWVKGMDVSLVDTFRTIDSEDLWLAGQRDEVKAELRAATTAAVERGIFGVPTMEIDGETFWGVDSLPFLRAHLSGEPTLAPLDHDKVARWARLTASASRSAGKTTT